MDITDNNKIILNYLNTILLAQKTEQQKNTSLYGHRKILEKLIEQSINNLNLNEVEREYKQSEDFFIFIYALLRCFHMYDDFYEINKQELLKHFKKNSEKHVLNFKLSYIIEKLLYLTPEYDAELISAIQEFKEKKDNIFKNLRNLEEKINHRNLFLDHNNDSAKMYDVLIAHFKDAATSAAASSIPAAAAVVTTTMPPIKNGDEKKVERFKRKLKDDGCRNKKGEK